LIREEVGYVWVFERAVVYGESLLEVIHLEGKKNFGEFVGLVRGLIPVDDHYVLYEYLKHTHRFIARQKERAFLERIGLSRRKIRKYHKITEWLE